MSHRKKRSNKRKSVVRKSMSGERLESRQLLAADLLPLELDTSPDAEVRSIDGSGNNVKNPEWGSAGTQLVRSTTAEYGDGISTLAGEDRPSAREVSNAVSDQTESVVNSRFLTDYLWQWGQFVDHDIDLTGGADPAEDASIEVPTGDPFFDPFNTGTQTIGLTRSNFDESTGTSTDNVRQQINSITSFVDGSMIYGSDEVRAAALRTLEGGRLATSEGDLLPYNEAGFDNAGGPSDTLFLAGDVRANEQAGLTAMHTLFVREHNNQADRIAAENPDFTDEQVYQRARAIVIAEIQSITYNEYLPALLGMDALSPYQGYDSTVDPSISNLFSTAAYRYGHSMLSPDFLRLNEDGTTAEEGNLALRDAFFNPTIIAETGIDSLLRGLAAQQAQEIDTMVIDDVRNFLFGPPGSGGFDLDALNIQRGRDHGLADYNQTRIDLGLEPVTSFSEITSNPELAAKLEEVYGDVNEVDVWVGGLAEDHVPGSSVGELFQTVIVDQFERLRDGDRFWYQNTFSGEQLQRIDNTSLADIIKRNSNVSNIQDNVFFDSGVMIQEIGGRGDSQIVVRSTSEAMEIVDVSGQRPQVIQAASIDEVYQIIVEGRDGQADEVVVVVARFDTGMSGGVVTDGGHGRGDVLVIQGTPDVDEITVDNNTVTINGETIAYSGYERIVLRTGPGPDNIVMADDLEIDVIVDPMRPEDGRPGPDGGGDPGPNDGGPRPDLEGPRPSRPGRDQDATRPQQSAPEEAPAPPAPIAEMARQQLFAMMADAQQQQNNRRGGPVNTTPPTGPDDQADRDEAFAQLGRRR
ncbi:MAG: peroxidase family protein [Pirellulales bacterium]